MRTLLLALIAPGQAEFSPDLQEPGFTIYEVAGGGDRLVGLAVATGASPAGGYGASSLTFYWLASGDAGADLRTLCATDMKGNGWPDHNTLTFRATDLTAAQLGVASFTDAKGKTKTNRCLPASASQVMTLDTLNTPADWAPKQAGVTQPEGVRLLKPGKCDGTISQLSYKDAGSTSTAGIVCMDDGDDAFGAFVAMTPGSTPPWLGSAPGTDAWWLSLPVSWTGAQGRTGLDGQPYKTTSASFALNVQSSGLAYWGTLYGIQDGVYTPEAGVSSLDEAD